MKYEMNLELFGDVNVTDSYYEFSSVGRLYLNLTKANKPERWRRLLQSQDKIPNMQIWWEIHEKHEDDLLKHTTFETDDSMDQFVHISNSKPPKKKKSKKAKKEKQDTFGKYFFEFL